MDRENDYRTPLDRVDEEFLRRLLGTTDSNPNNSPAEERSLPASAHIYSCKPEESCKSGGQPLAMVYAEYQCWNALYEPAEGLESGTIFRELEFPFRPTPCAKNNCTGQYLPNPNNMRREVRRRAYCR